MPTKKDFRGLVDFETDDKNFQDILIKEYKWEIFDEQYCSKKVGSKKRYYFYELRIIPLYSLLLKHKNKPFNYCIKRSDNKEVLESRVVFSPSLN